MRDALERGDPFSLKQAPSIRTVTEGQNSQTAHKALI